MDENIETSHLIADTALRSLRALKLAATPRNIELWYAYAEGRSPALARDIQKALGNGASLTQSAADTLYDMHILRGDLSHDVVHLIDLFENEIAKLSLVIDTTGEEAGGATTKLQAASSELKKSARDFPAVASLVESIVTVAKTLRESNARLETQLAQSSDEVSALRNRVESIQQEAMRDPLTGVKNRKAFDLSLRKFLSDALEARTPLSLVIADVDHFKSFNDRWGHQTGDHVLRLVADVMNANVKGQDLLARYGGEEFAILLPDTELDNAHKLADRIRTAVESRRLKKRRTNEDLGAVTMSMGVARSRVGDTPDSLVERADQCLYAAKAAGRNRVLSEDQRAAKSVYAGSSGGSTLRPTDDAA